MLVFFDKNWNQTHSESVQLMLASNISSKSVLGILDSGASVAKKSTNISVFYDWNFFVFEINMSLHTNVSSVVEF